MSKQKKPAPASKAAQDNRAIQLNPNNDAYWKARGLSRPASSSGNMAKGS